VHLDLVALVVEQPHQPGMPDRDVVALVVVVDDQLPVGGLVAVPRAALAQLLDRIAPEPLRQPGNLLGQRPRVDVKVDEDEPAERLDARREQPSADLSRPAMERPSGTPISSP
jgi:hypothetical protein